MKIKGKVEETIVLEKEVEVEVDDNASDDEIEEAIRNLAYEQTIHEGDHGWEGIETQDVEITWELLTK